MLPVVDAMLFEVVVTLKGLTVKYIDAVAVMLSESFSFISP